MPGLLLTTVLILLLDHSRTLIIPSPSSSLGLGNHLYPTPSTGDRVEYICFSNELIAFITLPVQELISPGGICSLTHFFNGPTLDPKNFPNWAGNNFFWLDLNFCGLDFFGARI